MNKTMWKKILSILTIGILLPSLLIFILEVSVGGMNPVESLLLILSRQFSEGNNLFLLSLWGLIPFIVLSLIVAVRAKKWTLKKVNYTILLGLLGILVIMIPAHWSLWKPLYTNGHAASTAVIAFVFIPFYCLISMLLFLGIGKFFEFVINKNRN